MTGLGGLVATGPVAPMPGVLGACEAVPSSQGRGIANWGVCWSEGMGRTSSGVTMMSSSELFLLLDKDWNYWKEAILSDLERVHPDIRDCVSRIDLMRMGHAMARPSVGAIFDSDRRRLAQSSGRLLFANSDLSGFSIFEEAQYRGVHAAEQLLRTLGKS